MNYADLRIEEQQELMGKLFNDVVCKEQSYFELTKKERKIVLEKGDWNGGDIPQEIMEKVFGCYDFVVEDFFCNCISIKELLRDIRDNVELIFRLERDGDRTINFESKEYYNGIFDSCDGYINDNDMGFTEIVITRYGNNLNKKINMLGDICDRLDYNLDYENGLLFIINYEMNNGKDTTLKLFENDLKTKEQLINYAY